MATSIKFDLLEELYESSLKFLAPLSLEQTYKIFIDEVVKIVSGKYGSIILLKKGRMHRVYSNTALLNSIKPRKMGYTYRAATSKVPKILTLSRLEKIHPDIKKTKVNYNVIIPLAYKNKSIGVFSILASHRLTKRQFDLLKLFSPLGMLAIRKAQLLEEESKAIDTRDLFISLASHELRTPITTSYIYLQLIERNYIKNKPFDPTWVTTLKGEMERLSAIIDGLLELNQIRNGKFLYSWQECDIEEIMQRAVTIIRAKYNNHKIKVNVYLPKKNRIIIGDSNKLIGVFINLLDNAVKHSDKTAKINISLKLNKKLINVIIKDNGIGIPEKDLDMVFNDFYKATNNTKPGMGLGLFFAKQIIKKHKGDIFIQSQLGKGTTVQVSLPISKA